MSEVNWSEKLLQAVKDDVDPKTIQDIIDHGVQLDVIDQSILKFNGHVFTPLHYAVLNNNLTIAELLLKNGAPVNFTSNLSKSWPHHHPGAPPITYAVYRNNTKMCQLLFKYGATVKEVYLLHGRAPIQKTVINGNLEIFNLLLAHGASLEMINNGGSNILYYASIGKSVGILKIILDKFNPATIRAMIKDSNALHLAASNGRNDVIQLLVQHGDDVNQLNSITGGTPLHDAVSCGHMKTFDLLLKLGANPEIKDKRGNTAHDYLKIRELLDKEYFIAEE